MTKLKPEQEATVRDFIKKHKDNYSYDWIRLAVAKLIGVDKVSRFTLYRWREKLGLPPKKRIPMYQIKSYMVEQVDGSRKIEAEKL